MPVGTITFPTTIDSDQTLSGAANNVTVLLDQAINSTQTSIAVASTTFFPAAGFATIVDNLTTPTKIEIISYTQISGNTLQSVIRGAQGTTPQSFSTGYVEIRPTAGHHLALVDAVIAIENRLGTGSTLSLTKGGTGRAFTTMPGTDRIFFWDASANSMQLLELGTNLSITGTVLNATGGGGLPPQVINSIGLTMPGIFTVTPPIITVQEYSEFVVTANTQTANTVYAGPTTGAATVPAFRALVASDVPALPYVTSVGLSLPSIFTVSNSPVTSSGTLTATLATQAENLVLVGPINAPAATPTFRLLEDEDIPNVLTIHKNRHLTTNGFVKTTNGDGTYAVDTNTYLTGNQTITLSGDVTGSGATSITTTIANGAVTYAKIQNISATSRILGRKTAGAGSTEELTFSEVLDFVGSAAQGDILYRGSTGWARLAAGTNGQYLQTQGAAANPQWATVVAGGTPGGSSGDYQINSAGSFGAGVLAQSSGRVTATPTAATSGSAAYFRVITPADTALTASTQAVGIQFGGNTSATTVTRQFASGTLTTQREYVFVAPTYAFTGASTLATAATVAITGAPAAGTNATISNALALNVEAGAVRFNEAGSPGTPGLQFIASNTGFWSSGTYGSGSIGLTSGGSQIQAWNSSNGSVHFSSGGQIVFGSSGLLSPDTGIARPAAGVIRIANASTGAGQLLVASSSTTAAAQAHIVSGSASRVGLRVDSAASPSADVVQFTNNGSNRWTLNSAATSTTKTITAPNGATSVTAVLTESVTLSTSGATTDTTIQIPADSFVLAVSVRVTTTIAGVDSSSLQIGDATTAERFGSIGTLTANTTGVGLNQLQGGVSTNAAGPVVTSATAVRLTLAGGADNTPSAGVVQITIHYIQLTAATS